VILHFIFIYPPSHWGIKGVYWRWSQAGLIGMVTKRRISRRKLWCYCLSGHLQYVVAVGHNIVCWHAC